VILVRAGLAGGLALRAGDLCVRKAGFSTGSHPTNSPASRAARAHPPSPARPARHGQPSGQGQAPRTAAEPAGPGEPGRKPAPGRQPRHGAAATRARQPPAAPRQILRAARDRLGEKGFLGSGRRHQQDRLTWT